MIYVDSRAGSKELVAPLAAINLPVEETTLAFGDVAFEGRGEKGASLLIGIEHKKVNDLVSSMQSGRLQGHQLRGMLEQYDRMWLIIEGDWQHDSQGRATMWKGRGKRSPIKGAGSAVDLEKRILTLETRGGFRTRICPTRRDTVRFICALYRFWTDKDLDEHKSHLAIHAPDLDRGLHIPISDFRRMVNQIPGIGLGLSQAVEQLSQGSFERVVGWSLAEWANIHTCDDDGKSRKLGDSRGAKIRSAVQALWKGGRR